MAPPRRPLPGRGRGRPRTVPLKAEIPPAPPPLPSPLERRALDYADLERAMALADQAIGRARRALDTLVKPPEHEPMEGARQDSMAASAQLTR